LFFLYAKFCRNFGLVENR